ncbi:ribosome biogenesis protein SLX9-domain-containing protein [Cladorrhinum samala]|uniref:Ribosome biogenesis protein SLX9 n=1 Tax=Cladorrhinum samala TaxID=585594 RepID=A0AAV9HXG0_9PEZI|nr:ribosome biogenesis protein SLX9-domain-containing protein [Cladorrhinum samala]
MAPIAPKPSSSSSAGSGAKRLTARQKAAARLADPLLPRKLHRENNVVSDAFINSKRDKRAIKHSAFVSRIGSAVSKPGGKNSKRRRPSKKLVATLESLGDALDDITEQIAHEDAQRPEDGKVRHRSLKSRPGALKRKEKVVKGEMERFGRNLAQLAALENKEHQQQEQQKMMEVDGRQAQTGTQPASTPAPAPAAAPATANRWAALRGFISSTMEQNPAFAGKT